MHCHLLPQSDEAYLNAALHLALCGASSPVQHMHQQSPRPNWNAEATVCINPHILVQPKGIHPSPSSLIVPNARLCHQRIASLACGLPHVGFVSTCVFSLQCALAMEMSLIT